MRAAIWSYNDRWTTEYLHVVICSLDIASCSSIYMRINMCMYPESTVLDKKAVSNLLLVQVYSRKTPFYKAEASTLQMSDCSSIARGSVLGGAKQA